MTFRILEEHCIYEKAIIDGEDASYETRHDDRDIQAFP